MSDNPNILTAEATLLSQFANSPTLAQLVYNLRAYIDPRTNIDNFYSMMWNVDTATGYGLDSWGRIVGVGRTLEISSVQYFGFEEPGGGGASGQPWNQAPFYSGEALTSNYTLLDGPYRVLILAKALANICNATIPVINQILLNLFGPEGLLPVPGGNSYCTDGENMTITLTFPSALTPVQTAIIYQSGVLPKPAGVALGIVVL